MEAKLKTLKVAELKEILAKAAESAPARATKQDLVSRILASQKAIQVYDGLHPSSKPPPNDDLLAPPEEVDWNAEDAGVQQVVPEPTSKPTVKSKPVNKTPSAPQKASAPASSKAPEKPQPQAANQPAQAEPSSKTADEELEKRKSRAARFGIPQTEKPPQTKESTDTVEQVNEELEKRKARAARFGIPLVEPKPAQTKVQKRGETQATTAPTESSAKLTARAKRFGLSTTDKSTPVAGQKRVTTVTAEVDEAERERRQKRAERFGLAK